jgi:hypothetical protein
VAVRRLSRERVHELAEEIWTASSGIEIPATHALQDPRGSRAGASAQAAYRRHRDEEREAWREHVVWRAVAVVAAGLGAGLLIGLTVGEWLGWPMAWLTALLTGWRLRFRPSASTAVWRRQAAAQRRTAQILQPLEERGYLVLHDVALPGWPASLDHLVIGPTGVWVIESWPRGLLRRRGSALSRRRRGATRPRGLQWETAAIAAALAGGGWMPVRPLLCVHDRMRPGAGRSVDGIPAIPARRLAELICRGSPLQPGRVERATARALEVLRPAA